jgi:hypothetical protein
MMYDRGDGTVPMVIPYHYASSDRLPLLQKLDEDAWSASENWRRDSTNDLPPESWKGSVDQPAIEVLELCKRLTSETVALEAAVLRRDTKKMQETVARMKLQVRGCEVLATVQRQAMDTVP